MRIIPGVMMLVLFLLCGCQTYYASRVASGVVPETLTLKNRYRIVSMEVSRTAEYPMRFEWILPGYVMEPDSKTQPSSFYVMLPKLYPGVFAETETALPIHVDLCITKLSNQLLEPYCEVKVFDAKSRKEIGREDYSLKVVNVYDAADPKHKFQGWRIPRGIFDPDPGGTYMVPFELGMAGAIAAALEKKENNGQRSNCTGKPPAYRKIFRAPPPPSPEVQEQPVQATGGSDGADAAVAVDFFMGAMGGIGSMNRHRTYSRAFRQSRRTAVPQTVLPVQNSAAAITNTSQGSKKKNTTPKKVSRYVKVPGVSGYGNGTGTKTEWIQVK